MQAAIRQLLLNRFNPASLITGNNGAYFDFTQGYPPGMSIANAPSAPPSTIAATQSTSGQRPLASDAVLGVTASLFDGGDDSLGTTLLPVAEGMVLASAFRLSGVNNVIIGSQNAAGGRCYLGVDTVGHLGGGWGSHSFSTIAGTTDVRNAPFVGLMRATASLVELYVMRVSTGVITKEYSAAPSGTPNTTLGLAIGAANIDGTPGSFTNARTWRNFMLQGTITDDRIAPLMRALCNGLR